MVDVLINEKFVHTILMYIRKHKSSSKTFILYKNLHKAKKVC